MAVEIQDTGTVSLGGSSINPRNVSVFQQGTGPNYAGDRAAQLARSLENLTGAFSALQESRIAEQEKQTDLYVAKIRSTLGTRATKEDINNLASDLHPRVRQRVTEDYMYTVGMDWVSKNLENMPFEAMRTPEEEARYFDQLRGAALKEAGSDPLRAAGFIKAVEANIAQRAQQNSQTRIADSVKTQTDAFAMELDFEADNIAREAILPQLSASITTVAQKYNEPWLVPFLTRTAQIESSGGRNLQNPNSSAGGPFAFIDSTAATYGITNKNDFDQSTDGAARLAMDNYRTLKYGLGRDPTMGELYLAHQQGAGGALKLLSNPDALAVDVVGEKAVRLNGGGPGMKASEFASKWVNKFGNSETTVTTPDGDIIPAEAQRMRDFYLARDAERRATGTATNQELRATAAQSFIRKAIQYRDERFLLAMPKELLTPEIQADFDQAREQIQSQKVTDLRNEEYVKEVTTKRKQEQVMSAVFNDRLSGIDRDLSVYAIDPATGQYDYERFAAAQQAAEAGGNRNLPINSVRNASIYTNNIRNAFLTGDFSKLSGLQVGADGQPMMEDLTNYILTRLDINDTERKALIDSLDQEVGKVAFVQRSDVATWYKSTVGSSLDALLKSSIGSAVTLLNSDLETQIKSVFEISLFNQISALGGVPADITPLLKSATEEANARLKTAKEMALLSKDINGVPMGETGPTVETVVTPEVQALIDKHTKP